MSTWAIGDIQGCHATLLRLLERIDYQPDRDELWLVGDLVNRGPSSLEVLRWARREDVTAVLGNHDLHLLAAAAGLRSSARDTLDAILAAPDREELLEWLRGRPFVVRREPFLMVHAGLPPSWTVEEALERSAELEDWLRGPHPETFLQAVYDTPNKHPRLRESVDAFLHLRACAADGTPQMGFKGPPSQLPSGWVPWFAHPSRRNQEATIVFGHWAALGLHLGDGVVGLDSGCVWGRDLTAYRLEDGALAQVTHITP